MDPLLQSLRALGEANRLEVVVALLDGPMTSSSLQARMSMSQPSLSRHTRILREAGLIEEGRDGRQMIYRLTEHELNHMVATIKGRAPHPSALVSTINKSAFSDDAGSEPDSPPEPFQEWLR